MRLYILLPLVLLLACNAGQKSPSPPSCPNAVKTELYFGRMKDSAEITDEQFHSFIHTHLVNANLGLTIVDANGHWRNTATGKMDSENSKLVIMVYNSCDTAITNTIARAIGIYNSTFSQQSVLRVDYPVSYSFIEER